MSFPWLVSNRSGSAAGAAHRVQQAQRDLRDRAALLARLGYSAAEATARLQARVAWDYDPSSRAGGPHTRPAALSDASIAQLVSETYQRHAPRS